MLHSSLLEKTWNYIEHKDTIIKQINVMMFSLMLNHSRIQDNGQSNRRRKVEGH